MLRIHWTNLHVPDYKIFKICWKNELNLNSYLYYTRFGPVYSLKDLFLSVGKNCIQKMERETLKFGQICTSLIKTNIKIQKKLHKIQSGRGIKPEVALFRTEEAALEILMVFF